MDPYQKLINNWCSKSTKVDEFILLVLLQPTLVN